MTLWHGVVSGEVSKGSEPEESLTSFVNLCRHLNNSVKDKLRSEYVSLTRGLLRSECDNLEQNVMH